MPVRTRKGSSTSYTSSDLNGYIEALEERYGMHSEAFLVRWKNDDLDHGELDFVEWIGLLDARMRAAEAERRSGAGK